MKSGINCDVSIAQQLGDCYDVFRSVYAAIIGVCTIFVLIRTLLVLPRLRREWKAVLSLSYMIANMVTFIIRAVDPINFQNLLPRMLYILCSTLSSVCVYGFSVVRFVDFPSRLTSSFLYLFLFVQIRFSYFLRQWSRVTLDFIE